jgi:hypothetical protein
LSVDASPAAESLEGEVAMRVYEPLTMTGLALCVTSLVGPAVAPAPAQTVIEGSSKRVTVTCTERVRVGGLKNQITLIGSCPDVTVEGSSNTVTIAALGSLTLAGSNNKVIWADGIGGRAPRIDRSGTNNTVERKAGMTSRLEEAPPPEQAGNAGAAVLVGRDKARVVTPGVVVDAEKKGAVPPASREGRRGDGPRGAGPARSAAPTMVFADNREEKTVACDGHAVEVLGNRNVLTITGTCASVRITGNHNEVTVDRVRWIATPGNENTVLYRDLADEEPPRISNTGRDNRIRRDRP